MQRSGKIKGSGRKAGTPNKKTQALMDKCEKAGMDAFLALIDLAKSDDLQLRLSAVKELCSYLYPKRRAIEVSEDPDAPIGAANDAAKLEKLRASVRQLRKERFGQPKN